MNPHPERTTIDQFRTVFPPLLIALQRHLTLVRELVSSVASGVAAAGLDSEYWDWHRGGAGGLAGQLRDPDLRRSWDELERVHGELLVVGESCLSAVRSGDEALARRCLGQVFEYSNHLIELIVGGTLRELTLAFENRERVLSERYEREFLEAAEIGRFSVSLATHTILSADENFAKLFGRTPGRLIGNDIRSILDAGSYDELVIGTLPGASARVLASALDASGPSLEIVAYREPERAKDVLHAFAVNATAAVQDAQQRRLLSTAIDHSDQVVVITNARQEIVYVNPAFSRLTGYSREEAAGRNPRFLQGPETDPDARAALRDAIASGRQGHLEIVNYRKNGSTYWVELSVVPVRDDRGVLMHWIAIERDISDRKAQEREIERLAMEDHLTGLLNRRAAEARLAVEWSRARRDRNPFAVALVDADRFKLVNDQYGHHVGDQVLMHLARTLERNLRGGDWIARWGGEEFLMCLHGLDARGAVKAGERARNFVKSNPVPVAVGTLPVTVSIGVALYSSEIESIDQLVAEADALLYEAKHTGRDRVLVAGPGGGLRTGLIWEGSQLQSALHDSRVLPAFQAIVSLQSGAVVGEEALARIRTREEALIQAQRFIHAAEALHLVNAIDRTITRSALERTADAVERQQVLEAYFINLAAQSLADQDLVAALREQALAFRMIQGGINPMVIEITERQSLDMATLRAHLEPLLDVGFRLALDDFGSGYSSFRYLAELPVDFLKLEAWMVRGLVHDARTRQLVETIVSTARTFGVRTVAECVEDGATAQVLCDVGVDWAQGHYFGRPRLASGQETD
ncbi:MAG: EAL domain-containing protein [Betaproteobacteria bacterium]|nr:EAL domain-containing protein [Betaproteobacteria bacterium]